MGERPKCNLCGGATRSYHSPGITRIICVDKCNGWTPIMTIDHKTKKLQRKNIPTTSNQS